MNTAPIALVIASLFLWGCSVFRDPMRPIEASPQLSEDWESASIIEHALILTPLRFAQDSPQAYRRLLERSDSSRDADGREVLSIAGYQDCPEHKFILDRAAGKLAITTMLDIARTMPVTSIYIRRPDGWHYSESPPPMNRSAEQAVADEPAAALKTKTK